jgi:acylphosphatase
LAGDPVCARAVRKAVRARVHGRVQGVGYRDWTVVEAAARGLEGWVRNRSDGTVEAVFAGPGPEVDAMIAACRVGPAAARVDRVDLDPAPDPPSGPFRRLATA